MGWNAVRGVSKIFFLGFGFDVLDPPFFGNEMRCRNGRGEGFIKEDKFLLSLFPNRRQNDLYFRLASKSPHTYTLNIDPRSKPVTIYIPP